MKPIKYHAVLFVCIVLSACTEEIVSPGNSVDLPVVEAFLKPGNEVSVLLTKMVAYDENMYPEPDVIDVDTVHIKFNGTDYALTQAIDIPGKYVSSDSTLIAESGRTYNLEFIYKDDTVRSHTSIPSRPANPGLSTTVLHIDPNVRGPGSVLEPMTVTWTNPDNTYHLIVLEYLNSSYLPISENLDPDSYSDFRRVSTEPILGTSFDLDTRQHLVFFGSYRVTIYKVNEEYVNLYENVSQSTLNLTEPLTNIENGLGIFTGVNSVSRILYVQSL